MEYEQKNLRGASRDDIIVIWHPKKLWFWENYKEAFNWPNSVSWIELPE